MDQPRREIPSVVTTSKEIYLKKHLFTLYSLILYDDYGITFQCLFINVTSIHLENIEH